MQGDLFIYDKVQAFCEILQKVTKAKKGEHAISARERSLARDLNFVDAPLLSVFLFLFFLSRAN